MQSHLLETESHVKSLEQVFNACGKKVKARKCKAIIGLLQKWANLAADFKGSPARNAGLNSVGQNIEHYESVAYGCLKEWAGLFGDLEAAALLQAILNQEKSANNSLAELAHSRCNREALEESRAETDACLVAKDGKTPKSGRTVRPLNIVPPLTPTLER